MTRKRWIYHNGVAYDRDTYTPEPTATSYQVLGDITPYRSMIDGSEITSRSRHREHLKAHGMVEVGNDSSLYKPPKPIESPPGLKETIIRAVNDHEEAQRRKRRY